MSQAFEQDMAKLRDGMPRVWWALYTGALEAGFGPAQAYGLVTAFILSQNTHGIRPDRVGDEPAEPQP